MERKSYKETAPVKIDMSLLPAYVSDYVSWQQYNKIDRVRETRSPSVILKAYTSLKETPQPGSILICVRRSMLNVSKIE